MTNKLAINFNYEGRQKSDVIERTKIKKTGFKDLPICKIVAGNFIMLTKYFIDIYTHIYSFWILKQTFQMSVRSVVQGGIQIQMLRQPYKNG